jgi:hypothetical protein
MSQRRSSKWCQLGLSGGVQRRIAELGTRATPLPAAVAQPAVFLLNFLPHGAFIVVVVDIPVALANGMPGWDLRHQSSTKKGLGEQHRDLI